MKTMCCEFRGYVHNGNLKEMTFLNFLAASSKVKYICYIEGKWMMIADERMSLLLANFGRYASVSNLLNIIHHDNKSLYIFFEVFFILVIQPFEAFIE